MTLEPGIHDITAADYHAGGDTPMLSSSIAKLIVSKSPAHAKAAHPILNPDLVREDSARFDIGQAAHKLFLEGEDAIAVYSLANDWRTKDSKEFREIARAGGRIPLLLDQAGAIRDMVAEARAQLDRHRAKPSLFADGKPEQTLVWPDDHGVTCCARLDWLRDDHTAIDDLKTCGGSAEPSTWAKRSLFPLGYAIQARFYQRGVRILTGVEPVFRFAVVETKPPYALSVVALSPADEALVDEQIDKALATWATCLEKDMWPGYTTEVAYADVPGWVETEWLEREEMQAA